MSKLTYSGLDVLLADPEKPIPEEKRRHQLTRMYIALDRISGSADNPTESDLALLSDVVALTAKFLEEDYEGFTIQSRSGLLAEIDTAERGLVEAYLRYRAKGVIRLNGGVLQALKKVMETYFNLLLVVPERVVIQLHRATEMANIKARNENKAIILKGAAN